jgi:hypothetical protein
MIREKDLEGIKDNLCVCGAGVWIVSGDLVGLNSGP